jgi:hypothetical protein
LFLTFFLPRLPNELWEKIWHQTQTPFSERFEAGIRATERKYRLVNLYFIMTNLIYLFLVFSAFISIEVKTVQLCTLMLGDLSCYRLKTLFYLASVVHRINKCLLLFKDKNIDQFRNESNFIPYFSQFLFFGDNFSIYSTLASKPKLHMCLP